MAKGKRKKRSVPTLALRSDLERAFEVSKRDYPFRSRWLEKSGVAMHYIDEGKGMPVLFLHGNPTWSFLYRNCIKLLRNQCRCIAVDYPGFGFSDHPKLYRYRPQDHAVWIEALIQGLELDRFILVMHDWGGPIGLSVGVKNPQRVNGMVLANTWCWPPEPMARLFSLAMGGVAGKILQLELNFFVRVILPSGIHRKDRKKPAVLENYAKPFPTAASRMGTYIFPQAIRTSTPWLRTIEKRLPGLAQYPIELVWGMKDPLFGWEHVIERWQDYFPGAHVQHLKQASHYVPEDDPQSLVRAVRRVLKQV